VVWVQFDPTTLQQTHYLWFGSAPGQPLPPLGDRIAKHSKGDASGVKAERQGLRVINKGAFEKIDGIGVLADNLFGKVRVEA
jgi:hypothetical protein